MEKTSRPKETITLSSNPAQDLAGLILASATEGPIATAMHAILRSLPANARHNNTLTKEGLEYVRLRLICEHPAAIKAMEAILQESDAVSGAQRRPVHAGDTTELFAADRPKTGGDTIDNVDEVKKESAIFTYDVLQQTPQLLGEDVDQYHYERTREDRPTTKTATGVWQTKEVDPSLPREEFIDEIGHHTYVLQPEEVTIQLTPVETPIMDDLGKPKGLHDQRTHNTVTGEACARRIDYNIKRFRRTGLFGLNDLTPAQVDAITPKVDGEALYIKVKKGRGFAVDRKGSYFEATLSGKFEEGGKNPRSATMLTEWVPRIQPGASVYLTHCWQFGVPNNVGVKFNKLLTSKKTLKVCWAGGKYSLGYGQMRNYPDTVSPLRFPEFGVCSDGIVVHRGLNQRFIKPYRTVDIIKPDVYAELEARGVRFKGRVDGCVCEYAVEGVEVGPDGRARIILTFVKVRLDKNKGNSLDNILDLLTAMDFDTWFDELDEYIAQGKPLVLGGDWGQYKAFVLGRDKSKNTIYKAPSSSGEN